MNKNGNKIASEESEQEIKPGKILDDLLEKGILSKSDFNQISKHLLNELLDINAFDADFKELTKSYLEKIKFSELKKSIPGEQNIMKDVRKGKIKEITNVISNEKSFHKYICKKYFNLIKEPKEVLLETFMDASKDLKKIDDTLLGIRTKIENINKNGDVLKIQEQLPIFYHYKELNEKAKEKIINFLKNDIERYALDNSVDILYFFKTFGDIAYSYRWNPDSYIPQRPDALINKFPEMPYPEFQKVCELYKKEDGTEFNQYLADYITENDIIFAVGDLIEKHHLLDMRKEIIDEALTIYANGKKIMFSNTVPSIIEGIFHDICILTGSDDNILLNEGFQQKVNRLEKIYGWELHYEYYSFKFRLIRNKVAHGRLEPTEISRTADLLLLDLYHACKLVFHTKLKFNQKRFVIEEFNKDLSTPNYKYILEYLLNSDVEIPSFYGLQQQIQVMESTLSSDKFWEYLVDELDQKSEIKRQGINAIVKKIIYKIPKEKRCKDLFKKIGKIEIDHHLTELYFKSLTKDYYRG